MATKRKAQLKAQIDVRAADERGQSMVLITFMIIGILAFVGIAVDVGFLFARSSQFSSAVDAAALAGVVEVHQGGVDAAIQRADEFLDANGWPIAQATMVTGTTRLTELGIPEFAYTVTWPVDTFFMAVVGFDEVPVTRSATAAYYALTDMPTATQYERGMINQATQFVYGPKSCTAQGDPVSSPFADAGEANPDYPLMDGTYVYRIRVPADYITDTGQSQVHIQLFDPDTINGRLGNSHTVTPSNGDPAFSSSCTTQGNGDTCIVETGEPTYANPLWVVRVDETWSNHDPASQCPSFRWNDPSGNTTTRYELYYRDENEERVDLAAFESNAANAANTDMKWVTPGISIGAESGSFDVTLDPIPLDEELNYNIYMNVTATAGSSKNGWDIWAGPPSLAANLPADPNARNLYILDNYSASSTRGVEVYAQGYLPQTVHQSGPVTLPLAAVDAVQGGGSIYASLFDFESSNNLISFGFDTLAAGDFRIDRAITCKVSEDSNERTNDCNNKWVKPQYAFGIPTNSDGIAFYGGYLMVDYNPTATHPSGDEHVWSVRITSGRPFLTR